MCILANCERRCVRVALVFTFRAPCVQTLMERITVVVTHFSNNSLPSTGQAARDEELKNEPMYVRALTVIVNLLLYCTADVHGWPSPNASIIASKVVINSSAYCFAVLERAFYSTLDLLKHYTDDYIATFKGASQLKSLEPPRHATKTRRVVAVKHRLAMNASLGMTASRSTAFVGMMRLAHSKDCLAACTYVLLVESMLVSSVLY